MMTDRKQCSGNSLGGISKKNSFWRSRLRLESDEYEFDLIFAQVLHCESTNNRSGVQTRQKQIIGFYVDLKKSAQINGAWQLGSFQTCIMQLYVKHFIVWIKSNKYGCILKIAYLFHMHKQAVPTYAGTWALSECVTCRMPGNWKRPENSSLKRKGELEGGQVARFTALSFNHRQMNGHRPCFIWAGLMPGLWKHWQGQINHTLFSLGLENIEERKNERVKGGWKTHSLLLDGLQFYSVPAAWYDITHGCAQPQRKLTKTIYRDRYFALKETSYWERKWNF